LPAFFKEKVTDGGEDHKAPASVSVEMLHSEDFVAVSHKHPESASDESPPAAEVLNDVQAWKRHSKLRNVNKCGESQEGVLKHGILTLIVPRIMDVTKLSERPIPAKTVVP